jgi:hypothetical protein
MRKLKELTLTEIPKGHPLRDVLLAEKDHLPVDEYLAKMEVWLFLATYQRLSWRT